MIEVIEYYNQVIADWIQAYYADGVFLLLAIVAFIYLYVSCKELRYKFLLPVFLMLFIAVNPILYTYIFRRIIYWRLLWMFPTAILVATAIVVLLKKMSKLWMKWGLLLFATAFIITQGEYMFSDDVFARRSNWEKLSQETIDVCDIILGLDESPRAIIHSDINTEVRQYAPKIELMYGRDSKWYIRGIGQSEYDIYYQIEKEPLDCRYVLWRARQENVNFIVVEVSKEMQNSICNIFGYKEVARTLNHIVYCDKELVVQ